MRFPKEGKYIRVCELPVGVPKYKNHVYLYKDLEKGLFFSCRSVQGVVDHLEELQKDYNPANLYKIINEDGTNVLGADTKTFNYELKKEK